MKKALKTNVITTVFFVANMVNAQFRPNVFPDPVGDDSYEGIDSFGQENIEDSRFSHQQQLSASFSLYKGVLGHPDQDDQHFFKCFFLGGVPADSGHPGQDDKASFL